MRRKVINISRKKKDFLCKICGKMVDVGLVKKWIIETDEVIIKTWDYGHRHDRVFRIYEGKVYRTIL